MPAVPSAVRKLPQAKRVTTSAPAVPPEAARPIIASGLTTAKHSQPYVPTPAPQVMRPLYLNVIKCSSLSGPTRRRNSARFRTMRHSVPNGDIAEIFDRALTLLLREIERQKLSRVDHPRSGDVANPGGRYVPAAEKRKVWARDQGQCAFVGAKGRCVERGFLEFHHVVPFAEGGETTAENLQLRCRAHNAYEARKQFGPLFLRERMEPYGRPRWTAKAGN